MSVIELLRNRLEELDHLCGRKANYPDEVSFAEFEFKLGQISSLLTVLECPLSCRDVFRFMNYYAEEYHRDEFTKSPDIEATRVKFYRWLEAQPT